jgi:hypothetical protein
VTPSLVNSLSFGQEYKYNPYPSQKYQSPQKSVVSEHIEIGILDSTTFLKHDSDVRAYHSTLQNASEQHIDDLHRLNMSDLDALTKKLKESMAVLDVTEPSIYVAPEPVQKKFGLTTFKTDAQQTALTTQLNEFRQNPFVSINDAQPAMVEDDLTRVEEPEEPDVDKKESG